MATHTRDRILETTAGLLQHRGFHGTSLNDILAESGAPRGSLYYYFPGGKEQLALEATVRAIEEITRILEELMSDGSDPAGAVRTYVEAAAVQLRESGFTFGCPVAPILLDLGPEAGALAQVCRDAFADWQRTLREGFVRAGIADRRAASLAVTVVSAIEGALLLARADRSTGPLETIAGELATLIDGALRTSRR
ncbi:MAG TPA: TetR/AcrR family transcriptional regulator [Thermoanaerobaculia bacterium]|nr:TetR/AcrR family transcriptional regulator [Thermoanaerobaculia bacterium]